MSQSENQENLIGEMIKPGLIESAVEESKADDPEDKASLWMGRLISALSTILIVVVVLIGYHYLFVQPNKQKFAVVDLAEVLTVKELQVTLAAMRPDATDETKSKAYDEVAKFGKDVELALNDMQQECGCSIFVKAAIIKSGASEDLTLELKQRLGMENVNQADLMKQLKAIGGGGRASILDGADK